LGARHPEATVAAYGGLADDVVGERPVLLLTRELSHALHPSTIDPDPRSPMIQRVFARTVQSAGAGPTDPDERAFLAIAVVNALRQRGTPEVALQAADAQRPALTPGWQDVSALNRSFFYLQAGMAAAEVGDLPRAMRRFARGYDESGGEQSQFVACSAAGHHALLLAFEGRRAAAVQWAERAERGAAGQPWIQRITAPPVRLARAYLALDTADPQGAEQIVADSDLTLSIFEMWPLLVDVLARAALAAGQAVTGLDVVEHTAERQYLRRPPTPLSTVLLARARCDLLIADGQLTRASLLLERATADPIASSAPPVLRHLLAVEDARLQLIAGRPQSARSRVARCLAEEPVRRQSLDLLVIDAAAALAQGQTDDAARSIGRVVSMTPDDQLAALLRGVDSDSRGGLVELVRGARAEAIRGIPDLLTATPLYPAGGELVELTERERSVLGSLAQGATLADIASADVLSVNTVKKQAGSLYRRLGAETRAEALRTAAALGFLDGTGRAAQ
jgi:LuxR family maltose regulon positive regulatory protein